MPTWVSRLLTSTRLRRSSPPSRLSCGDNRAGRNSYGGSRRSAVALLIANGAASSGCGAASKEAGEPALPLELPEAEQGIRVTATLTVDIYPGGQIVVDGEGVSPDRELVEHARLALKRHPDLRVLLRIDREAKIQWVIDVLDSLAKGGVRKIAFAVALMPSD